MAGGQKKADLYTITNYLFEESLSLFYSSFDTGDDDLAKLEYSFDQWKSLEEAADNGPLFVKTGLINLGTCDSTDSTSAECCNDEYLLKHMGVLKASGKPFEWLTPKDIASRYGDLMKYPEDWGAVYDPNGGILLAHKEHYDTCSNFV